MDVWELPNLQKGSGTVLSVHLVWKKKEGKKNIDCEEQCH